MDFVRDAAGRYHFLELNPRPWGSIEAAARAAHAGLLVVMNRCPAIDHPAMIGAR